MILAVRCGIRIAAYAYFSGLVVSIIYVAAIVGVVLIWLGVPLAVFLIGLWIAS